MVGGDGVDDGEGVSEDQPVVPEVVAVEMPSGVIYDDTGGKDIKKGAKNRVKKAKKRKTKKATRRLGGNRAHGTTQ